MIHVKNSKIYPWVVVALPWVVALLNYLDRQMLSTMQESMKMDITEFAVGESFGCLMGIFLLIYGLMSPVAGILADRLNRKWMTVDGLFAWSTVTYEMDYATTFDQVYWLHALMGVSEALYLATAFSMVADYHSSKSRSLAVGIHMSGFYTGQVLGGFGVTIASNYTWHTVLHWFGVADMVYAVFLIFTLLDIERKPRIVQTAVPTEKSGLWQSLMLVFGTFSFWILLFYFMASSFPGWGARNWLPTLFATNLGIDMATVGPTATISIVISSFSGMFIGGTLSDRWVQTNIKARIYTSTIGLGLTIPALILIGLGHSYVAMIGATLLFGIGYGMFDTSNMPILCQTIPQQQRATAYGIMNMGGVSAGYAVIRMPGSSTDAGNLGADFSKLPVIILIAVVLMLVFLKPKREICGS